MNLLLPVYNVAICYLRLYTAANFTIIITVAM